MIDSTVSAKFKELGEHGVVYGLGSALQSALAFVLIPLYTRNFSAEIYGVFALCIIVGQLAGNVCSLGIANSLSRSYFDYENDRDRKTVVGTSVLVVAFAAIAQISTGFIFRNEISALIFETVIYGNALFLSLLSSSIAMLTNLGYVILRLKRNSARVVILNALTLISSVTLVYLLLEILEYGLEGALLGLAAGQLLLLILMIWMLKPTLGLGFSMRELKVQVSFGWPMMLSTVIFFCITTTDRLLIEYHLTLADVGIYNLGFMLGSIINVILVMPFGMIWTPMRAEYRRAPQMDRFYGMALTYYFMIGCSVALLGTLFSDEIILLISGSDLYHDAKRVMIFTMFSFLILGAIRIIDNGIFFSRKTHYHVLVFGFCLIINVLSNYFSIPVFGFSAPAINLLLTCIMALSLIYIITNRIERVQMEKLRLLKTLLATLIIATANLFLERTPGVSIIIELTVKTIFLVGLFLYFYAYVLNADERTMIKNWQSGT